MFNWIRKIFWVRDDDIFLNGMTVKEYRETMEYLKRDHIKEMEDMLTEINEEINKDILTKLLNQDKDE